MKWRLSIATALLLLASTSAPSGAVDVGVRAGYYFDADDVSIGTELLTSLNDSPKWFFNPNVEFVMGQDRDMVAMNADFHYDFEPQENLAIWAGAGPGVYVIDRGPFRDNDVNLGVNLLTGLGANSGTVRPFVQGKAVLMDNPEAALAVGIRF